MILSDREIKAALARGALKITPEPSSDAWSSTAIDLTLAKDLVLLRVPKVAGVTTSVCPADPNYQFDQLIAECGQKFTIGHDGYIFKSTSFLLSWTKERIQLPPQARLAARVEGKSSLARLGIGVHVTAPTIHAGFGYVPNKPDYVGSPLQLEMWNCGPLDVKLVEGMRICQLIIEVVDGTPDKGYSGRFLVQGPPAEG